MKKTLKIEHINLNQLSAKNRNLIKQGRKAYKKSEKEKFLAPFEFFKST